MKYINKIRMSASISPSFDFFIHIQNYVLLIGKYENSETK